MAKTKKTRPLSKADAEKLARKIWRAGLGAYGAAYDVSGHQPDTAFEALAARGKTLDKAVRKRAAKTGAYTKLQDQIVTIGRQIARLRVSGPKARKAGKTDRAALLDALGLTAIVDTRAKTDMSFRARLDALEEMTADLTAGGLPDGEASAERLRHLAAELNALAGPVPTPDTDGDGRLSAPDGQPDDLKRIKGIGLVLERKLNDAGIYHFWQVAGLSDEQTERLEADMSFPGRIRRDDWRAQAKSLIEGTLL